MLIFKNIFSNYVNQVYLILLNILSAPLYLNYLGAEAYGLIGFFALVQLWLNIFDLGMGPSIGRQAALLKKDIGLSNFHKLLRSFESIFYIISGLFLFFVIIANNYFANFWFKEATIQTLELRYCLILIICIVCARLIRSLYLSALFGLEMQVSANIINVVSNTFKYFGSLLIIIFASQSILHFFCYQLVIAVLELIIFRRTLYNQIEMNKTELRLFGLYTEELKNIAPFALGVAGTSGLWIIVNEFDKLILSQQLALREFGYFSIIVICSNAIISVVNPIIQGMSPKLIRAVAMGDEVLSYKTYSLLTQLTVAVGFSIAFTVFFNVEELLFAWTSNLDLVSSGSATLQVYVLASGLLLIMIPQYFLQVGHGKLRLHVYGSAVHLIVVLPALYFAALDYGAVGCGVCWIIFRLIFLFLWTPIIHNKFLPGVHLRWLIHDVGKLVCILFLLGFGLESLWSFLNHDAKLFIVFKLVTSTVISFLVCSISSRELRVFFSQLVTPLKL